MTPENRRRVMMVILYYSCLPTSIPYTCRQSEDIEKKYEPISILLSPELVGQILH